MKNALLPGLALTAALLLVGWSAGAQDMDGDGVLDATDNCPAVANGPGDPDDQSDADGDGFGDACECGDASGDGRVSTIDARLIQRCTTGGIECGDLCDVTGDGICNTIDSRLVQRFAVGTLGKADLRCEERPDPAAARASFASLASEAREGDGELLIDIELDRSYTGPLAYRVSGASTANAGDHAPLSGTVQVSGMTAQLRVFIADDGDFEPVEVLMIELDPAAGGRIVGGAIPSHSITILDNDAIWDGVLGTAGGELNFSLAIEETSSGRSASLVSEGTGMIPMSTSETEGFVVAPFIFDATTFEARTEEIDVELNPDDALLVGRPTVGLLLSATPDPSQPDLLTGTGRLRIGVRGRTHLTTRVDGTFVLTRRPAAPSEFEVGLFISEAN